MLTPLLYTSGDGRLDVGRQKETIVTSTVLMDGLQLKYLRIAFPTDYCLKVTVTNIWRSATRIRGHIVLSYRWTPTFRRNMLLPSLGLKRTE